MTKLAVTGSREWPPYKMEVIFRYLDKYLADSYEPPELWHGECPYGGVDAYAAAYGHGAGWKVRAFPPKPSEGRTWIVAKDYAIRNRKMLDAGPDLLVAFFLQGAENKGTQMTYDMAPEMGIKRVKVTA